MFYHLTRSTVEQTMATILPRALAQGWPVMVRGCSRDTLDALDLALWLGPEEAFLPHGLQGGPQDSDQPILLGTGAIGNAARALLLLERAVTTPEETMPLERVWVIFNGADEAEVQAARALWSVLTGAGMAAQYWSEEGGRWEKKTEKPAR